MTTVADGTHVCAVPISDEQLWEMTASFVADGLAAGERVVYFEDGSAREVLDRLADDAVPVHRPLAEGQLSIVPAEATRAALSSPVLAVEQMLHSVIDESLERGWSGFRMTAQTSYGLLAAGGVDLPAYDAGLERVLAERPEARALCLYDRRRFPDEMISRMRALHTEEVVAPAVYDDGLLRITRVDDGRSRLAGEVDHSNRPVLSRLLDIALDEALRSHSAPAEITLDLASLRFLDVAGAVSLVHAAEAFPSSHRLVLDRVRPRVLRVLDRCGAPFAAQLRVRSREDPGRHEAGEAPQPRVGVS
jgi:anti-anti-sigma regulatory factor